VTLAGQSIVSRLGKVAWIVITAVDTPAEARLDALEKNVKRSQEFRDSRTKLIGQQERHWDRGRTTQARNAIQDMFFPRVIWHWQLST
jgi:hypothetical protein